MTMWQPEPEILQHLDAAVSDILTTQKPNGEFGTEPWISTDQNVLFPLAVAWSQPTSKHFHDDAVLDAIVRGGLALEAAQDDQGMWIFRKKDYSEWGPIRMPWAYSRWMRAYALIRPAMPVGEARGRWERGLLLGYEGIAAHEMGRIHNIPAHHAMGLYCAGKLFECNDWCVQGADFLRRVALEQSEYGWWPEHGGPVVMYNFVYADALGAYFAMSGDEQVLPALQRAATYHATFTYPDGSCVETIDGRNPYHEGVRLGNAGLTRSAEGRGWTARQHRLFLAAGSRFEADYAAAILLYSESGDAAAPVSERKTHTQRMGKQAMISRQAPWFTCLSAYTVPIPPNRWGQDRQNFVSLYHDDLGLILGGGNTKLQPLWSTFTIGDTDLLVHAPGEEEPEFAAVAGLIHCPMTADLGADDEHPNVTLHYGDTRGRVQVHMGTDEVTVEYAAEGVVPARTAAHVPLLPHLGTPLWYGDQRVELDETPIDWMATEDSDIVHGGWRLTLVAGARLQWPLYPHNPYRKDGHATLEEARLVLSLPLGADVVARLRVQVNESNQEPVEATLRTGS